MERTIDGVEYNIPEHVAIILDGNGRWAKKRMLPRNAGHLQGAKTVENIIEIADDLGIKYLTLYAFSTENWSRPQDEVDALMKLLKKYLINSIKKSNDNNVRVKVIGERTKLSEELCKSIIEVEEATKQNTGLTLTIAINYGSRDEIIRGMKKFAKDCIEGSQSANNLNVEIFNSYLDTNGLPDPDLLIRTSGEERLSNYLLWQLAYTEFYFTDVLWPDFNREELINAICHYNKRERRYGGI